MSFKGLSEHGGIQTGPVESEEAQIRQASALEDVVELTFGGFPLSYSVVEGYG